MQPTGLTQDWHKMWLWTGVITPGSQWELLRWDQRLLQRLYEQKIEKGAKLDFCINFNPMYIVDIASYFKCEMALKMQLVHASKSL